MAKLFGLALAATASLAAAATQDTHGLSWGQWGEWAPCDRLGQTTKRRRICQGQITNKALKKTRCLQELEGTNIQAKQCGEVNSAPTFVLRNGREDPNRVEWQEWQEWSKCNSGSQKRTRFCGKAINRGIMPSADCKEKSSTGFGSTKNKETRACSSEILRGGQDTGYSGISSGVADGRRSNSAFEAYMNQEHNYLSARECYHNPGTPKSIMDGMVRIVGGVVAELGAHPHIAMLSYVGFGGYGQFCDGSIIHKRFILTAAHCFVGWDESASTYEVLLGAHSKMTTEENQETYLLESIECHKEYKVTQRQILYDICILKTKKDIAFNKSVWPICLPDKTPPPNSKELAGTKCVVAGWGDTRFTGDDRVLNQVDVPVLTPATCQDWYNDNNILVDVDQHVCAGYEEGGRDACQGDSGGPFVCDRTDLEGSTHHMALNKNKKVLTGIVSFGVGCAQAKNPGVYTNINHFLPWIFDEINKHDDCFPENPCKNGGSCLDNFHGHTCECASGWTGEDCSLAEEDLTKCFKNACVSGECILDERDTHGKGYTCECDYGYGGPFCNIVEDQCVTINCNLGTCEVDANNQPSCVCPSNWSGPLCSTDVNECLDNPCAPGAGCDNIDGGFECSCPIGFEGDGTREGVGCIDINECETGAHNCGPSSVCTNNQGGFKCSCQAGFTGNPPAIKCREPDVGESCPNVVSELNKLSNNFVKFADDSPRYEINCGINGQNFNGAELDADKSIRHPISPSKSGAHTDNACIFKCLPGQMMSAPAFAKVNGGSAARIDCVSRAKGAALKPNRNQLRCHGCNPVEGVIFSDCQIRSKKMINCNATCASGGKTVAVKCQKKKGKFSWSSNVPKC